MVKYPSWESNPNLKFRKLPFYPLNYRGIFSGCKDTNFFNLPPFIFSNYVNLQSFLNHE